MDQEPPSNPENPDRERKDGGRPSPLSKRFITRKIEEMFQNQPDRGKINKNSEDTPNSPPPSTVSADEGEDKKTFFLFRYPLLFLLGILIAGGWLFFFIQYYQDPPPLPVSVQVEKFSQWQYNTPLISTPIISDVDGDGEYDIAFADSLGYLRAADPRTQEIIYQTYLGGPVIASLATLEVDKKSPAEIFSITENGKFFTINRQGDYLYSSREEYFSEQIYAKPLVLSEAGIFYLAGMEGRIWGTDIDYGEVLWMNDNSSLAQSREGIFSSPILLPLNPDISEVAQHVRENPNLSVLGDDLALVVAGEKGTVAAFNLASGGLRWESKLDDRFKATPLVVKNMAGNKKNYLLLVGVDGGIWILDYSGKVINHVRLEESFISSPVNGKFLKPGNQVLLSAESGNMFLVFLNQDGSGDGLKVEQILDGGQGFIASPLPLDWNDDGRDGIMAVSREGFLFLWELDPDIPAGTSSRLLEVVPPYRLDYKVTASPIMGDLNRDGQLEVVIAGENGSLSVLTLRITPPIFSPGEIPYSQFLHNSLHDR